MAEAGDWHLAEAGDWRFAEADAFLKLDLDQYVIVCARYVDPLASNTGTYWRAIREPTGEQYLAIRGPPGTLCICMYIRSHFGANSYKLGH